MSAYCKTCAVEVLPAHGICPWCQTALPKPMLRKLSIIEARSMRRAYEATLLLHGGSK